VRLTVLGSGSRGNALVVESNGHALLIDAGFGFRDLEARCDVAGVATESIRAIALTHEHGDHARGAATAANRWGVPVAASRGTLAALRTRLGGAATVELAPTRAITAGPFTLAAFPTAHDAADPVVLTVEDAEGGRLGVAYDVGSPTTALRHAIRNLDALVLEANHDEVLLRSSHYPPSVRARIAGSAGHLSNRECAELVAAVAHPGLSLLVLAHLSDQCNRPELARAAVESALGGRFPGRLVVASQDQPTAWLAVGGSQLALPLSGGG
jgi:phosphoribosyl 1,2-cyclic phosphodiesterase